MVVALSQAVRRITGTVKGVLSWLSNVQNATKKI